jgi:hypothetical protein
MPKVVGGAEGEFSRTYELKAGKITPSKVVCKKKALFTPDWKWGIRYDGAMCMWGG